MKQELYKHLLYKTKNTSPNHVEKMVRQKKVSKCFLALCYLVHDKDVKTASLLLDSTQNNLDTVCCLEAKMLLLSAYRKNKEAIQLASDIIKNNPNAVFAHYLLAKSTSKEPKKAFEHYLAILQTHPEHDIVKLQAAEMLARLKKYEQALQYVKQCKPNFIQKTYLLLLPIDQLKYRILFLALGIFLAIISNVSLVIWSAISTLLLIGVVAFLIKLEGSLVSERLLLLEILLTASWFLAWLVLS